MIKINIMMTFLGVFFWANIYSGYSQSPVAPSPAPVKQEIKSLDVNKDGKRDVVYYGEGKNISQVKVDRNYDGKPDIVYYSDGKYVTQIKADSNYDGRGDVAVNLKNGKFESAQADTDYDGKTDKKFTDAKEFNKWLNEKHPDLQSYLNKTDWRVSLLNF